MRVWATMAAAFVLWAAGATGAQAAPTIEISGTLSVSSVTNTGSFPVSAAATVTYSCTPTSQFDYCGGYFTKVTTVPAGEVCQEDAVRWVGPIEAASATSRSYTASWDEYTAGPRNMTACLYAYVGESSDRLLAQTNYTVPVAAPAPPVGGNPGGTPGGTPGGSAACPNAFKVNLASAQAPVGRRMPVRVFGGDYGDALRADALMLEMKDSASGAAFFSHAFAGAELDEVALAGSGGAAVFYMRLDPGDGPAYAQLSWSGPDGCAGTARTPDMQPVKGARGQVKARGLMGPGADGAGVRFGPRPGGSCLTTEMRKMRVTVKVRRQSRSFTLDGACGDWSRRSANLKGVRVTTAGGALSAPASLLLMPRRSAGENGTPVKVTVRASGATLLRRNFEAVWDWIPSRRIWQGTDRFWNYCVNEGKETYSSNGRLYCIEPGLLVRFVALR